jgi:hypothetical protein
MFSNEVIKGKTGVSISYYPSTDSSSVLGMAVDQANTQALDLLQSFESITELGYKLKTNKAKYLKNFDNVKTKIDLLRTNSIALFYVYKDKINATMSTRRFQMNQ